MFTDFRGKRREGERERERETWMWERNMYHLPLIYTPTRDQPYTLGMCPDWELNSQPFGVWDTPTKWTTGAALQWLSWVMFQLLGSSLSRDLSTCSGNNHSWAIFSLFMVHDHCQKISLRSAFKYATLYYYMCILGETFMMNQVFRCPMGEMLMEKYIWRKLFS